MEEEEVKLPPPSMASNKNNNTSSTIRFLGFLNQNQQDSDSNPFELDESEVIWSSSDFSSDSRNIESIEPISPALSSISSSDSPTHHHRHSFRTEKFGLSAALSDDHRPFVQRKPSLNPSFSAATAARTIPPVSVPRSISSSDGFSNSSSGKFYQSAPVNVPNWGKIGSHKSPRLGFFEEEDDATEEEMLPPHEIVARSHVTTFSVFEGVGRTLKGRDLRRVRNAVFQKTGFLD